MEDYPDSLDITLNKEQQRDLVELITREIRDCEQHDVYADTEWYKYALHLQEIKNMINKDGYTIIKDIFIDYNLDLDRICNSDDRVYRYIKEIAKIIEEPDRHDPVEFFRAILYCCNEFHFDCESMEIDFSKFFSAMMDVDEYYTQRRS